MSVLALRHSFTLPLTLCIGVLGCGDGSSGPTTGTPSGGAPSAMAGTGGAPVVPSAGTGNGGSAPQGGMASPPMAGNGGMPSAAGAGGSPAVGGMSNGGMSAAGTSSGAGAGGMAGSGSGGSTSMMCPATVLAAGNSDKTIQVGGDSRSYVLHVPAAYDGKKAVPLIIDFHGLGGSGQNERTGSPYPAQVDAEGVVMAFPSGKSGPSGPAWNVGPCCVKNTDDVAFAKALVSEIEKVACIDPKRVYAVGFSMGGGMSHYLACHASDIFAAVAPAAFDLLKENVDDCKPTRPLSVVSFRGTSDPIVPYAGGASSVVAGMPITFLGAKATFEKWAAINKCSGAASAEDAQGCSRYSGCQDGVDVALCTKQGGSHEAGNASIAWPILKKHTLP